MEPRGEVVFEMDQYNSEIEDDEPDTCEAIPEAGFFAEIQINRQIREINMGNLARAIVIAGLLIGGTIIAGRAVSSFVSAANEWNDRVTEAALHGGE